LDDPGSRLGARQGRLGRVKKKLGGGSARAGLYLTALGAIAATAVLLATTKPRAQTVAPSPNAVPVTAARAEIKDVPITESGIGTVQAFNSVLIRTHVDGTLMQFPVAEGQVVKPGDLIAVIDPRPYQAVLDQAMAKRQQDEAQLSNGKADLARYGMLMKQDYASHQQYDTQQSQVLQTTAQIAGDQAMIEAAQLNLAYCYIISPIAGRVGLRQVDPGNIVHATDTNGIVSIAQDHPIAVIFTLPQQDLPSIVQAMADRKLEMTALSGDDKIELDRGVLLTPDNTIDVTTGTIKLKASFPNPHNTLWPGQFVDARLLIGTAHHVVTVPAEAVQHGPDGLYVYIIKPDSTVERQAVESETRGDVAVISKGLQAGQQVVVRGQSRLDNGIQVAVEHPQA
jgi:membrane fusion protein, multidrug efflux system